MRQTAHVHLKSQAIEVQFEWLDFDGDDCFNDFRIQVITATGTRRFDFGGCAVHGLRTVSRFFRNVKERTVGGGFRNPDIRYYDVYREKDGYRLVLRFEGNGLREEFYIQNPSTEIDDEFMRIVYSD
jgi:hypothetical protein